MKKRSHGEWVLSWFRRRSAKKKNQASVTNSKRVTGNAEGALGDYSSLKAGTSFSGKRKNVVVWAKKGGVDKSTTEALKGKHLSRGKDRRKLRT